MASGPTWQAIRNQAMVLKLSVNLVRETTFFNDTVFNESSYDGQEKISLWRSTFYVGGWAYVFNNRLRVSYECYWQPAFYHSKNYRTQLDVGLSYPLGKGLAFEMVYIFSHENVVVENIKEDDQILTFGLSYSLRKK